MVANVKVGLPEKQPSFGTNETAFFAAFGSLYDNSSTANGTVWPCGSVLQYAVMSTDSPSLHPALGSCVFATKRFGFLDLKNSVIYPSYPSHRTGSTIPDGWERVDITGDYTNTNTAGPGGTATITSATAAGLNHFPTFANAPVDPVYGTGQTPTSRGQQAFNSWRTTIQTEVASWNYLAAAPIDMHFVGPAIEIGRAHV